MIQRRGARGITLVEILVAVVAVLIVITLTVPAFGRIRRQERIEECAAHLRTLHEASGAYYGKTLDARPAKLGSAYWAALAKTTPPLVTRNVLQCPLQESENAPPVHYQGPVTDPRAMVKDNPIGCDLGWNHSDHGHEGGNILLRSGSVVNDNPSHAGGLWFQAAANCRQ
jgi:type II secretory pathway pseudopilin PulG